MKTSLSPLAVVREAWLAAQASLKPYSHRNSPKKFTQRQLFALLVLKEFDNTTYRGVWGIVKDHSDVRAKIQLETTPHWTTLQKACDRLLNSRRVRRLIEHTVDESIRRGKLDEKPDRTAIDTSGFEATSTSRYYARGRKSTAKDGTKRPVSLRRYPKIGLAVDCESHCILAVIAGQGPNSESANVLQRQSAPAFPHSTIATVLHITSARWAALVLAQAVR